MQCDICIVGMGIGGLATALALHRAGFTVIVVEKDSLLSDRKQGYGLTLTNSLSGPLSYLGLLEEGIERNCPSHCHFTFNSAGSILGYYGRALKAEGYSLEHYQKADQGGNRGNLRIPRQELRQMMLFRLPSECCRWGYRFISCEEHENNYNLTITFQSMQSDIDNLVVNARMLIGADGIRSVVRLHRDTILRQIDSSPLRYIGVSVILGISAIDHPLLRNRGFYVLDGQHRLFTMPFLSSDGEQQQEQLSTDSLSSSHLPFPPPQIMWQLSFSGVTEAEAMTLKSSSFASILTEAKRRTNTWFPAVHDLLNATLDREVWATPLYDRDAMQAMRAAEQQNTQAACMTVLGDACHPMSMFKGQGANQALEDATLFAKKLVQRVEEEQKKASRKRKLSTTEEPSASPSTDESIASSSLLHNISKDTICSVLRTFEREMVTRADKKVQASRQAAAFLHSLAALDEVIGISGIHDEEVAEILGMLREEGLHAGEGETIEDKMVTTVIKYRQSLKGDATS